MCPVVGCLTLVQLDHSDVDLAFSPRVTLDVCSRTDEEAAPAGTTLFRLWLNVWIPGRKSCTISPCLVRVLFHGKLNSLSADEVEMVAVAYMGIAASAVVDI